MTYGAATTIVYQARNLVNGKSYIGFTTRGLAARERQHRETARGKREKYLLHLALKKYGDANIVFEVLANFDGDETLAKLYEWEMISRHKPAYNLAHGGDGGTLTVSTRKKIGEANRGKVRTPETIQRMREIKRGKIQTPATRAKISAANTGRTPPNLGVSPSAETRAKISAANKGQIPWTAGKKHSLATRAKMSEWQVGRKLSQETRDRLSAARVQISKEPTTAMQVAWATNITCAINATKKALRCVEDGNVFESGVAADRYYGLKAGTCSRVASGEKQCTSAGLHFVRHEVGR